VPSEAVCVPRTADGAEAHGWLLCYVYDREADRSTVMMLDTQDFDGEP
jgi:carotenoid cleavage dioxygenase-like enzyme